MTFHRSEDGLWHWEYRTGYTRDKGFRCMLAGAFTMGSVLVGVLCADRGLSHLGMDLAIVGVVALLYALIAVPCLIVKTTSFYTADESCLSRGRRRSPKAYEHVTFERVTTLMLDRKSHSIEIRQSDSSRGRYYACDEDIDAVWQFLLDHCPRAEAFEDASAATSKTARRSGSSGARRGTALIVTGIIVSVFCLSFSVGWLTRGPRIGDFTGIGEARIVSVTYTGERYSIVADCEIDGQRVTYRGRRGGRDGMREGDVVPVTYNVKDPAEYVLNTTPAAYARWYRAFGIGALVLLAITIGCFTVGIRLNRMERNAEKQV